MVINWAAGHKPTGDEAQQVAGVANAVAQMGSDAVGGTTTSTTYTSTLTGISVPLSLTFVAYRTAMVVVVGAFIASLVSNGDQWMAPSVTGTSYYYGPTDADAAFGQLTNNNIGSYVEKSTVITGLTIGQTYTITPQYRTTAGTALFSQRRVIVHN